MFKVLALKLFRARVAIAIFSFATFVLGLGLGKFVDELLAQRQNLSALLMQGTILATLLALLFYISLQFKQLYVELDKQKISVTIAYGSARNEDKQLYVGVNEAIAQAQHSVRVLGMFRPFDLNSRPGRSGYYHILSEVIEMKIRMNEPFVYERIVQVTDLTPSLIRRRQVDEVTFSHCKQMLEWSQQKSAVSLHVKQIPNIMGAYSFLIVDDTRIFLIVPEVCRNEASELKLDNIRLILDFDDAKRLLGGPMISFFSSLLHEADPVLRFEP